MINIAKNEKALTLFLQLIHSYGAFLKHREIVKSQNDNPEFSNLYRKLQSNAVDYYSWQAREHGIADGLSEDEINEIMRSAREDVAEEKNSHVNNLVSSEKYYRKLKHVFIEQFPELKDEMQEALKNHIENMENKKREKNAAYVALMGLSDRYISFFWHCFDVGDGNNMAISSFASFIFKKYQIEIDKEKNKVFENKLSKERHNVSHAVFKELKKLKFDEIAYVNTILEALVNNATDEDIGNVEKYSFNFSKDPVKRLIPLQIVKREMAKFKRLHDEYKNLVFEMKKV